MIKLIPKLEQYLHENLGVSVRMYLLSESRDLPQFLRERYLWYKSNILEREFVIMIDRGESEQTPAIIGKHINQARAKFKIEVIYVRYAVTSYNRKRLIEHKVPFIIPGNQMYLPMLGLDLREHLNRLRVKKHVLSPSTQAFILHIILKKEMGLFRPSEIAHRLGYSPMTMTRAFDELEKAEIGEHTALGKKRYLKFVETGKPLWEKALPYLNTPLIHHLKIFSSLKINDQILAGQSALAQYTTLAEPETPVFAFANVEWDSFQKKYQGKFKEVPYATHEGFIVEIWKYSPAQFSDQGKVDRLSLYLSMKNETDERVQSALDELLGGMKW